jgi:tRNA-specific 2-thiouridylase
MKKKRVWVGLSGGVDSAVAALLLQQDGHEVIGATMRIWDGPAEAERTTGGRHACYGPEEEEDIEDARRVAIRLGIPFHVLDLRAAYRREVLEYFRREYRSGRTPNPCVRCNRTMKFGFLLDEATHSGSDADLFATGHYARTTLHPAGGTIELRKAADRGKDQSYFLHSLTQSQLRRSLFPLGSLTKGEVRERASAAGLDVAFKPESQDFMTGGSRRLLADDAVPGPVLDERGREIGRHRGIGFYTVGQRHGLGIASGERLYVLRKDAAANALVAGTKESLAATTLTASEVNWISGIPPADTFRVKASIRYRHREAEAEIDPAGEGRVRVRFQEPQAAIAPGQSVVFYEGETVLGGGIIDDAG